MSAVLDRLTQGDVASVVSGDGCSTGGVFKVFFSKYSDVGWAATETANQFDTTNSQFTGLTMNASKTLFDFGFDIKSARVDSVLTDGVFYRTTVTITVIGKNASVWATINNLKNYCGDLWMAVLGNDKTAQHIGVMRNTANDGFQKVFMPLELVEHTDTTGVPSEKSRHELVFACESEYEPLLSTMTLANYTALLTAA